MNVGEWRLGRRPALDGLRGVAVLLVIAFHVYGQRFPSGGTVGVTVFFVLSGFLITSLLLAEKARLGSVSLQRFYRRRALRLLPALLVMLAVGGSLTVAAGMAQTTDVLAVLLYVANWWQATGHGLGMLVHTWTLATEEQFYLLWPIALMPLLRTRRPLLIVVTTTAVGMAGRVALDAAGIAPGFVHYTQGEALLAGCALALWIRERGAVRAPRIIFPATLAAVVALCWVPWSVPIMTILATAISLGLIWAIATHDGDGVLSGRLITAIGRRSYGLYLWHLPVIAMAWRLGDAAGLQFWQFIGLGLVVLAGVTELSWRYVEQPFLRLKDTDQEADAVSAPAAMVMVEAVTDDASAPPMP